MTGPSPLRHAPPTGYLQVARGDVEMGGGQGQGQEQEQNFGEIRESTIMRVLEDDSDEEDEDEEGERERGEEKQQEVGDEESVESEE